MARRLKAGLYHLTEEEASASVKAEQQKRKALRWEEVRARSRSHAAEVRHRAQQRKEAELERLKQKVEQELEASKDVQLQDLGFRYQTQLMDVGEAFARAEVKADFAEAKERSRVLQSATAKARGAEALKAVREEQRNKAESALKHTACLKASREAEKVRAAEIAERDPPQPDAIDLLFTPSKRSPSKQKSSSVLTEDGTMISGKDNPLVNVLAEMSTLQREIFGDVELLDFPTTPMSPTKSQCLKKGAVTETPNQNSFGQQARLRSYDAARREERRKNARKLLDELERMDMQMLAKYSECKENVEASIEDKVDVDSEALLLGKCSLQPSGKQPSRDTVPKQKKPWTAVPLSSPSRPLFRQAVHRSSRRAAQELGMIAPPLPLQTPSIHTPTVTPEGKTTGSGIDKEPLTPELSPSFDPSSFLNVTARRRPRCPRTEDEDLCFSLGTSWNKEGVTCSLEASPRLTSPSVASTGSSTPSYLGLPDSYRHAHPEAHLFKWQEESTQFSDLLLSKPHVLHASTWQEKDREHDQGSCGDAVVAAEEDSPLQSPTSLDTAFLEASPPCSEGSFRTPASLRSEPEGSSLSCTASAASNFPTSDGEDESRCLDKSDESPLGSFFDQVSKARPPSMVRMLANQEVLIPHQLSTIAEMDSSLPSTASKDSVRSSSSSVSSTGCCEQGLTCDVQKGAQKIFTDLEDKVKAIEAELNSIGFSPTTALGGLHHASSPKEQSLLMDMAEPTLVPADATTLLVSPYQESSMSDSLMSFIRHEESFARAELCHSDQLPTS